MPYNLVFIPVLLMLFLANPVENTKASRLSIKIKDRKYLAEYANTAYKASKGYMFTDIDKKQAMVFYYKSETRPTFYNKNVRFSLRVYWINKDKKVIESSIFEKDSFRLHTPKAKIVYVVEIPLLEDFSNDPGVMDGQKIEIEL